jgi:hypothetical protein
MGSKSNHAQMQKLVVQMKDELKRLKNKFERSINLTAKHKFIK